MAKRGNIFIVSAPSGCGKTTIVNRVLKKNPGIIRSVSITTRKPRIGEKKKKDYYFVSEATFKNKAKKGEFLEWTKNFGYYYGTPKRAIYDELKRGKDLVLTIDVKGASQVRRKIRDAVLIFISPPSIEELARRLKERAADKSREILERLKIAEREISFSKKYDYIVINDKLDKAVRKLESIIIAKGCEV